MATLMGMGTEIRLPTLEPRPWGLFTQVVSEHPAIMVDGFDRGPLGAKWLIRDAYSFGAVDVTDPCDIEDVDDLLANNIDLDDASTRPFQAFNSLQCSTIGGLEMPEINRMLMDDEEITRSAALVLGLTTSVSADHLNLVDDSTSLGASASITAAIAAVENALADRIANGRGHVLIPLTLLAAAKAADLLMMMDGQYVTPAGHRVIADAGHDPQNTIFGTGALTYWMSEARMVDNRDGFSPPINKVRGTYVRYAWVAFNPNHAVRTTV
jgi:hypothetical protein